MFRVSANCAAGKLPDTVATGAPARTFQPLTVQQREALLAKTRTAAAQGKYELFKTSTRFDGTAQNPQWLG